MGSCDEEGEGSVEVIIISKSKANENAFYNFWVWYRETTFYKICERFWFIIGILIVIGLAKAYPYFGEKNGLIYAQYSLELPAIIILFLIRGFEIETKAFVDGLKQWKIHLFCQCMSLGIMPLMGSACTLYLIDPLDPMLGTGFIIVMALPTTTATNSVFTQRSGGNEALAIINSVLGNCIGIFVTPLWCEYLLSSIAIPPLTSFLPTICYQVIIPCILGLILQSYLPSLVAFLRKYINFIDMTQYCLLILVYCSFCDTFNINHLSVNINGILVCALLIVIFVLGFAFVGLSTPFWQCGTIDIFSFSTEDSVALAFTMGSKTAALGLPMINLLFKSIPGYGIFSIPLLLYYTIELLLQSLIIPYVGAFVTNKKRKMSY